MFIDKKTAKKVLQLTFKKGYFHPRRFAFQVAIFPLYESVRIMDGVGRWLDDRFFSDYQSADIGEPIFIMASPRSGTTLLHRLMSLDPQFTSYTLWQTILPTLTAYRAVDGLTTLDKALGSPLDKIQYAAAEYFFRGWEGIHETRFNHAEEDEAIFCLQLGTPAVWLGWPFIEEIDRVAYIDRIDTRQTFTAFVRGTMKRHMWHAQRHGENKTLLLKNVFLAGRLGVVSDAAPNARFVNIVRHPYRTIGSLLSFFTVPWRYHSPDIALDGPQVRAFTKIAMDYALTVHRFMQELPEDRAVTIMYDDLVSEPEAEIARIYDRFGLEASDAFRKRLHNAVSEHRNYESAHDYQLEDFGLTKDIVYEELQEIFEAYDLPRNP